VIYITCRTSSVNEKRDTLLVITYNIALRIVHHIIDSQSIQNGHHMTRHKNKAMPSCWSKNQNTAFQAFHANTKQSINNEYNTQYSNWLQ